jgi:hypothetical protein
MILRARCKLTHFWARPALARTSLRIFTRSIIGFSKSLECSDIRAVDGFELAGVGALYLSLVHWAI